MKSANLLGFLVLLYLSPMTSSADRYAATSVTSMKSTVVLPTPFIAPPVKPVVTSASKVYSIAKAPSVPLPAATCPQTKVQFDSAMDLAMLGTRPELCDFTMWAGNCEKVYKSVMACNFGNCTQKCHLEDAVAVGINQCGTPSVFKSLVYSYSGRPQVLTDACMATLKKQGH